MIKSVLSRKFILAAMAVVLTSSAFAFNVREMATPYQGPERDVITLIITSNYKKSRLLAELIQRETKQPILLLPAGDQKGIYFMPSSVKKPALEIKEENIGKFVALINPQQILVLGDRGFVHQNYIDMIDKKMPVFVVNGRDWVINAKSVAKLLDLNNLASDYARLYNQVEGGKLYKPSETAPADTAAKTEDTARPEVKPEDTKAKDAKDVKEETKDVTAKEDVKEPEAKAKK
ncbi:MAG: hypothetical protein WCV67_11565 [Victivallaceae bacterium]|jgi:hypothetical protein